MRSSVNTLIAAGQRSFDITGSLRRAVLTALVGLLLLGGCRQESEQDHRVDPSAYDSFFLWAGVRPPAALEKAETVYVLAGEVRAADNSRFVPLRPKAPSADHADIWLVLRVERIDWEESTTRQLMRELSRWETAGARMKGVQIDFDSATLHLDRYADFLAELREELPEAYRLSVTGLMDWSANGDPMALAKLGGIIDEIVIQTYQARDTIPGYERYLATLSRLGMPYRIALVEGGEWVEPIALARDLNFRGYVVFLLPRRD